jgi:hypothetical protein
MAEPLKKKIVQGQVTYRLTLTPEPRAAVLLCEITRQDEAAGQTPLTASKATFKLTRDELTPIVMAFLMGG